MSRLLALLTAALLLAGCGADDDNRSGGAAASGDDPQRIVSLHPYTLNAMLDIGVVPDGTMDLEGAAILPEHRQRADAIPVVGANVDVNFERVAELGPDLILGSQVPGVDYGREKLERLAPTELFEMQVPGDWQRVAIQTADALGRRAEGDAVKRRYEDRVAELRETYAGQLRDTTFALLRGAGPNFQANDRTSWAGVVLDDLGVRFARLSRDTGPGPVTEHSFEDIAGLRDADVILVEGDPDSDEPQPESRKLMDQPLWDDLPADVVEPLRFFYPMSYGQGLAVLDQLEEILRQR